MKCKHALVSLFVGLSVVAAPIGAIAQKVVLKMHCSCAELGCGRYPITGGSGDIFTNVSTENVKTKFQAAGNTGWNCVVPAVTNGSGGPKACFCKGYCGGGGVGGDPNSFNLGLSPDIVAHSYGGGKPGNQTGWLCGDYRGDFK